MNCADPNNLISTLVFNTSLDEAYEHFVFSKKEAHSNHDSGSIQFNWPCIEQRYKKIIKTVYRMLESLKLTLLKPKTYIGKAKKGFDFLGYRIWAGSPDTVSLSQTSIQRFRIRRQRLYEQRASNARVAAYEKHWLRWATSGLGHLTVEVPDIF